MYREILNNMLLGTKAGFKAILNLVFNQKAERSTMNRQKSRAIVENVLSGTKAGFKSILNFEHAIERNKMENQKSKSTFSAILMSLTLGVAVFLAGPAAAQKKYVTDPTTGKVVSAPEYGGTITFARTTTGEHPDAWYIGGFAYHYITLVNEKLGIGDWGINRDVFDWRTSAQPLSFFKGHLAESWETPDPTTMIFHIHQGVHWHKKAPNEWESLDGPGYRVQLSSPLGDR